MTIPNRLIEEAVELYGNKYLFVYPNRSLPDEFDWILGRDEKKGYIGICSHCGSHIEYNGKFYVQRGYGALDKDYCECPECNATLEIKKGWYGKRSLKQRFYVQSIDVPEYNKVVIYEAIICLEDWNDYMNEHGASSVYAYDLRSTTLTPGVSETIRWNKTKKRESGTCGSFEASGRMITFGGYPMTQDGYIIGVERLFSSYLAPIAKKLELYAPTINENKLDLLIRMNEEPMTEVLYSMGFEQMARDRSIAPELNRSRYMNFKAASPKLFLRDMPDIKKIVVRQWLNMITQKEGYRVRDIEKVIKFIKNHEVKAAMLNFSGCKREKHSLNTFMEVAALLPKWGLERISNYIKKHGSEYSLTAYIDYLEMAAQCNADFDNKSVAFPKNLKQEHDRYIELVRYAATKEQDGKFKDRLKKELFVLDGYSAKGLVVVVPRKSQEIIQEGEKMHNCIGNYAKKHAQGDTTILFIHRQSESETSFFDLEIDLKGNDFKTMIRQCYGKYNKANAKTPKDDCFFITEKEHNEALYVHEFLKKLIKHINWCNANKKLAKKYYGRKKTA